MDQAKLPMLAKRQFLMAAKKCKTHFVFLFVISLSLPACANSMTNHQMNIIYETCREGYGCPIDREAFYSVYRAWNLIGDEDDSIMNYSITISRNTLNTRVNFGRLDPFFLVFETPPAQFVNASVTCPKNFNYRCEVIFIEMMQN